MVKKVSLIKAYLGGWTGEDMQKIGKRRRKSKKRKANTTVKKYRLGKEQKALLKRKKKINKIMKLNKIGG